MTVRNVVFIYGSETGTAQDVTETLWMEAKQRHVPAKLYSIDEYDIKNLSDEMCVVFIVSTCGQGEMPSSCRLAWRTLCHKSLSNDLLSDVFIAVLGLGDSTYQRYNFAAKKLFRSFYFIVLTRLLLQRLILYPYFYFGLCQLGAKPLLELSLADEQHELGIDGVLDKFNKDLFRKLSQKWFSKEMSLNAESLFVLPHRFHLIYEDVHDNASAVLANDDCFHLFTVQSNERVTAADHFQETHLLRLKANSDDAQRYHSGDLFWVHPYNIKESIQMAVEALGYTDDVLDRKFYFEPTDPCIKKPPAWLIKEPATLRECLTKYLDLQMIPRRSFFKKLSLLSSHKLEAERLEEFGTAQGIDSYYDYCLLPRRTASECLRDFVYTSKTLSPTALFDILTPIKPRAYSISSCPNIHSSVELLVAKVEYKSKVMREQRRGICSTFISRLEDGSRIFGKITQGTFKWPNEMSSLLLIGPGTGVAAFRSILNYRNQKYGNLNSMDLLFFGCRGAEKDYYFKDEWPKLKNTCVIAAFSRDVNGKSEHVQDKMLQNSDKIWQLINERNGYIYIAGRSGKMPDSVVKTLKKIVSMHGEDGDTLMKTLENSGRLQIETWT